MHGMPALRDPSPHLGRVRSLVAASAVCTLLLGLTACGGHGSEGAASAPRSTTPTTPTDSPSLTKPHYSTVKVPARTKRATRAAAHTFVADSVRLLAAPGSALGSHPAISGAALQDLIAMRDEYASKHYHVEGRPTIVSQQVIKQQQHPPRLVVAACVDNSSVTVLDKNGQPVTASRGPQRVMNLLTLTLRNGHWVVTRSSLPMNPTC